MFWIREFTKKMYGKNVVIVGSAPNPKIPKIANNPNTVIVCMKGSGRVAKDIGMRDPDITFSTEWAFDDTSKVLKDCKTDKIVHVFRSNANTEYIEFEFQKSNFKYNDLYIFPDDYLPSFYFALEFQNKNYPQGPMSFGLGVMMMCINFGAKNIHMIGIDPYSTGKFYESKRPYLEAHNEVDEFLIKYLNENSGAKIYTADKDLAGKLGINFKG